MNFWDLGQVAPVQPAPTRSTAWSWVPALVILGVGGAIFYLTISGTRVT